MWLWAPPSDHDEKTYVVPPRTCGVNALTEFAEPTMTVRSNGVVDVVAPTVSCSPDGADANVRSTVWGRSVTLGGPRCASLVRCGQPQLQMRGVLVVGGVEGAAGHAGPALDRVRMAVRRTVLQEERPGQRGGGERSLLGVGRMAREGDRVADLPGQGGGRGVDHRDGGLVAAASRRVQEHRHVVRVPVGGREIAVAVAVEIAGGDRERGVPDREGDRGGEAARTRAEEDADRVPARLTAVVGVVPGGVGGDDVQAPVPGEVGDRDAFRHRARRVAEGIGEGAVGEPLEHADGVRGPGWRSRDRASRHHRDRPFGSNAVRSQLRGRPSGRRCRCPVP